MELQIRLQNGSTGVGSEAVKQIIPITLVIQRKVITYELTPQPMH